MVKQAVIVPDSLEFKHLNINQTSETRGVEIINTGNETLTISDIDNPILSNKTNFAVSNLPSELTIPASLITELASTNFSNLMYHITYDEVTGFFIASTGNTITVLSLDIESNIFTVIDSIDDAESHVFSIRVGNFIVSAVNSDQSIATYTLESDGSIHFVDEFDVGLSTYHITDIGDNMIVVSCGSSLRGYKINTQGSFELINYITTTAFWSVISGNLLFVAASSNGVKSIDVDRNGYMTELYTLATADEAQCVVLFRDNYLVVSDRRGGSGTPTNDAVILLRYSDTGLLTKLDSIGGVRPSTDGTYNITADDAFIYVSYINSGLSVYSINSAEELYLICNNDFGNNHQALITYNDLIIMCVNTAIDVCELTNNRRLFYLTAGIFSVDDVSGLLTIKTDGGNPECSLYAKALYLGNCKLLNYPSNTQELLLQQYKNDSLANNGLGMPVVPYTPPDPPPPPPPPSGDFLATFTVASGDSIVLPLVITGTYNFTVDWGDETSNTITSYNQAEREHTYATAGDYQISVTGTMTNWNFFSVYQSKHKFRTIDDVGDVDFMLNVESSVNQFVGCENLTAGDWNNIDMSYVTDARYMLSNGNFNFPINKWDTSSMLVMQGMFRDSPFNQDISSWNVFNVTNMRYMFYNSSFNKPLNAWITTALETTYYMFHNSDFNKPLNNWDMSHVTDPRCMFSYSPFNQDLNDWDTSSFESTYMMFHNSDFNGVIGDWDVSNVTDMEHMFEETPFNQDIGSWDVSAVESMYQMFRDSSFNQDIGSWDVSAVTDMYSMFRDSPFNQDIGSWDVSAVKYMDYMFNGAPFDQDISSWDISNVEHMDDMFTGSLSTANYDALLIAWSAQSVKNWVTLDIGSTKYSSGAAAAARQSLIDDHNWTINDGGEV